MKRFLKSNVPVPSLKRPAILLAEIRGELRQLDTTAAQELLWAAGNLQPVAMKAREINVVSREVAELAAGEGCRSAITILREMIGDTERVQEIVDQGRGQLNRIRAKLGECRPPLSRMAQLPQLLSAISILVRIEANRLSGNVDDDSFLANALAGLAGQVRRYTDDISGNTETVTQLVGRILRETSRAEDQLHEQRATLVNRTQLILDSLLTRVEISSSTARSIDERYVAIRRSIDNIVMSLQVQDIAHQRIEHVGEAIARLENNSEFTADCGAVVALQRSQLAATRELVLSSLDSMIDDLNSVSARIRELTSDTATLASEAAEDGGGSFGSTIESGFRVIGPVFARYFELSRKVCSAFSVVLSSVVEMGKGVKELKDIQFKIHLTALNAIIEIEGLGADGVAQRALGTEIQQIAETARPDTEALHTVLAAIGETIRSTTTGRASNCDSAEISRDMESVRRQLSALSDSVLTRNQAVSEKLKAVLQMVDDLATHLRTTAALTDRRNVLAAAFDRALAVLDGVLEQVGYGNQPASPPGRQNQDASLAAIYSMESERRLHREHFGNPRPTDTGKESESDARAASVSLGEGIELF